MPRRAKNPLYSIHGHAIPNQGFTCYLLSREKPEPEPEPEGREIQGDHFTFCCRMPLQVSRLFLEFLMHALCTHSQSQSQSQQSQSQSQTKKFDSQALSYRVRKPLTLATDVKHGSGATFSKP